MSLTNHSFFVPAGVTFDYYSPIRDEYVFHTNCPDCHISNYVTVEVYRLQTNPNYLRVLWQTEEDFYCPICLQHQKEAGMS